MKRIFMCVGLFLTLMTSVFAEPTHKLDLICCSYHFDRTTDFNETNLGLEYKHYFEPKTRISVSVYDNSEYNTSLYLGVGHVFPVAKKVDLIMEVGVVTGYEEMPIWPVIVPGLSFYDTVHLRFTPKVVGASVTIFRW